ncbi:uncharacterized protein V2V93DRAFT_362772 [Kockiozyma suomiensis]|uniref:uncharacterized protein n=1 Tax=Kockiozyma suomiensis TaxID=1337062 RepID=UPI0033439806
MTMPPDSTLCELCRESIWIPSDPALDDSSDDDQDMEMDAGACSSSGHQHDAVADLVPDDVILNMCPSQHHYHWTCFLAHTEPDTFCPACHAQIIPDDPSAQLLATVKSDGGIETDYDIRPTLREERIYAQNPNLRLHEALFDACFTGDEERVWELLERYSEEGGTITDLENARDLEKGWTPLFYAAVSGREGIVSFLLQKGVDRTARDNFGRIAADYANEEGHAHIVRLLSE